MSDVLRMLNEGQRGQFKAPEPVSAPPSAAEPEAPPAFDVQMILKQGQRGQFKPPPELAAPKHRAGMLPQVGYGVREGIMGMANVPAQIPRAIVDVGTMAYNAITGGQAGNPMRSMEAPPSPEPQGFAEHAARAVGQGLPSLPMLAAGAAAGAPTWGRAAADAGKSLGQNLLPTVAGQVGGEAAAQAVPEQWQDAARFGGSIATGGATAVGQAVAPAVVGKLGGNALMRQGGMAGIGPKETFQGPGGEPVRATATQAEAVATRLREAAESSGPDQSGVGGAQRFQSLLDAPQENAPGFRPTTAQVAPLSGIVKLEDTVKTQDGSQFLPRAQQQNAALVQSVQQAGRETPWGVTPKADPAAIAQDFRTRLAALDAAGEQQVGAQRGAIQGATEGLGGRAAPATYGQEMRGAIQSELEPVQAQRRALWAAVDPDGTLALDAAPLRDMARQLMGELTKSDTLTAGERAAMEHASSLQGVVPFRELQQLRSNVLSASRQAFGGEPLSTQGLRRLTMLKGAIDDSLAAAVEQRAAREVDGAVSVGAGAGDGGPLPGGVPGPGQAAGVSASAGDANAAGRAPGSGGGDSALAAQAADQPGLVANFDRAAAERAAAAREATLREKERFGRGSVGQVLAGGRDGAPFQVRDADVPAKIFSGRVTEPATVQEFLNAVGPERGSALARDYLVSDLRRNGILTDDGLLVADKFAKWNARRGETIKMFPGLGDEFSSLETAQRALDDVQAAHSAALKEYQSGVAKNFLNEEPAMAVQKTLRSQDRVKLMDEIITKVQGNPDALANLRQNVIDYIIDNYTSLAKAGGDEVGSFRQAATREFVAENKGWLRRLMGGQGMQRIEQVEANLKGMQTQGLATTGSPTAERAAAQAKQGAFRQHIPSVLGMLGVLAAEKAGTALGVPGTVTLMSEAIAGATPLLVHSFRQRGIQTMNDLAREAMLHPEVARELMARPKGEAIGAILQRRVARAMQGVIAAESATENRQ